MRVMPVECGHQPATAAARFSCYFWHNFDRHDRLLSVLKSFPHPQNALELPFTQGAMVITR